MVVLRSTTPCVAVSSRSNSNLLTVISIVVVPTADAIASTGMSQLPRRASSLNTSLIPKEKLRKPAVMLGIGGILREFPIWRFHRQHFPDRNRFRGWLGALTGCE